MAKDKKPKKSRNAAATGTDKPAKAKAAKPVKAKKAAAAQSQPERRDGGLHPMETLAKIADHPLVADLLAIGAVAAVGALAQTGKLDAQALKSPKAIKAAGKAAAAAIGSRLIEEFTTGAADKAKAAEEKRA